MTKSEICRAIAEKLCKKIPEDFRYAPDLTPSSDGLFIWRIDPVLARLRNPHRTDGMTHGISDPRPNGRWVAVDFFTSEDASARLLDAMLATGKAIEMRSDAYNFQLCFGVTRSAVTATSITTITAIEFMAQIKNDAGRNIDDLRREAIALTAALWLQIEVGTID